MSALWRAQRIKKTYGIGQAEFERMSTEQEGRCAICGVIPSRPLDIDHCHETKKIRGLLCGGCNRAIAHAQHDPKILRAAAEYLEQIDG